MALDLPPTDKSFANKVVVFIDPADVAAATGIPTFAEVNAAFFAALHLYSPFNITPSQNTGTGPRKLGSQFTPTENGTVTYPAVEVQYSYKAQSLGTPGGAGNELYEFLPKGVKRIAVTFDAIDGESDEIPTPAVGDVYLVEAGVRRKGATGDGEFDQNSVSQSLIVVGGQPIAEDHVFTGTP